MCCAVEHHGHVNNPKIDPEKASGMGLKSGFLSLWNILRVNPLDPWKPHHIGQHFLFFLYITFIYGPLVFIISFSKYDYFFFITSISLSAFLQAILSLAKVP